MHTILVTVETEGDLPFRVDELRGRLAYIIDEEFATDGSDLYGFETTSSTVKTIWIDGRRFHPETGLAPDPTQKETGK